MTDCGCMTTSTFWYGTSNRKCASMTSSALFTSVAESTVIFLPMVQVGCFSASATVARETRSARHALQHGAMLGIHRHDFTAALASRLRDQLPCHHERFLVRERDPLPSAQG